MSILGTSVNVGQRCLPASRPAAEANAFFRWALRLKTALRWTLNSLHWLLQALLHFQPLSWCFLFILAIPCPLRAQNNYEIQVYGSETVAPGATMVEVHSNYTADGSKQPVDGVLPTNHAFHETLEITRGFTSWFETGFYVFSSAQNGHGWQWVGDHLRPRVRIPEDWHWPAGLSLSTEVGCQQRKFSTDTWNLELRPIIDKQWGPFYVAINPAFEKSLAGLNASRGFDFAPSGKACYNITKIHGVGVTGGVEYYGDLGSALDLDPVGQQQHLIIPTLDLDLGPKWEFNFGIGVGVTRATDHLIVKMIVGRRF